MNCSLPCGCGKCINNWVVVDGYAPKVKLVDVMYFDGKEFYNKPVENCYWGKDTLISHYRVVK